MKRKRILGLSRTLAVAALLPALAACDVVLSTHPVGLEPVAIEAEEWEGTWITETMIAATRKHPARNLASVDRHAIPEPERDGIASSQVGDPRLEPSTGEMNGSILLIGGAEFFRVRSGQEENDPRFVQGIAVVAR